MYAPLVRSAVTLVALVAVYQAYLLMVVPLVEPLAVQRSGATLSAEQKQASYEAHDRYQALLAAYFPDDHWSRRSLPIVLRMEQLMLILSSDYRHNDYGSIHVEHCAGLVLPETWRPGLPAPRETIVLEAPGGARLQFDDDFQPAQGKIGRILKGELPGQVTIRSDMQQPGPDDDLQVITRDLVMNESVIRTDARVEAHLGPNWCRGKKLDIRLSRDEHIQHGPSINGLQSLEIYEEVELHLQTHSSTRLGDDQPPTNAEREPPIHLTCQGRFHLDFLDFVGSFDQRVEVRRMRRQGAYDSLDCHELSLTLAVVDENGFPLKKSEDPNVTRQQRAALHRLQPIALEARGNPVRAEAPELQASARAQRMRFNLVQRRLTLDGSREVLLAYGASEVHAPFIEYQLPEEDSPQAVGQLSVAGPGWLRAVPDEARPDRVVDVGWKPDRERQFPVQIRRRSGQPVLTMTGQPVIDAHRLGKVEADRVELTLREVPADGRAGPALEVSSRSTKLAVIPEKLLAAGNVAFDSPALRGKTHQLSADFEPWKPTNPLAGHREGSATSTNASSADRQADRSRAEPNTQYDLAAHQIHLALSLSGRQAKPTAAACEGQVVLREVSRPPARGGGDSEEPLVVQGERLTLEGLDSQARFSVAGALTDAATDPHAIVNQATIQGRGIQLVAATIHADQQAHRFWIDGPGRALMQLDAKLPSSPAAGPMPVSLTWQQGLEAIGPRIVATGRVVAESPQGWLQANQATAVLTRSITASGATANKQVDLAEVIFDGNVVIDHRGRDQAGQRSHENLQLRRLAYNHVNGDLHGTGPGILRSVQLADQQVHLGPLGSGLSPTPPTAGREPAAQLRFLRVDFAQGLAGNAARRMVEFQRRVRAVYGPVDDWQQELPLHNPTKLPPDTVTLACERLQVNEAPHVASTTAANSPLGPLELRAIENVAIEGRTPKQGLFQAEAVLASYSQAKDLFVLQGDSTRDAQLRRQETADGQLVENAAFSIFYYRSEPRVVIDRFRQFDFQQPASSTPPRSARQPRTTRLPQQSR